MFSDKLQKILIVALALASLGAVPAPARAEDRHYMIVFASQTEPVVPRHSHTFAVFVRTSGQKVVETRSISWMPRSLEIEPFRMSAVPGINLDLADSLRWAQSVKAGTTMWGPFRIRPEFYATAARHAEWLNTAPIKYIMVDRRFRGKEASNCIHALSDLDTTQPQLDTGSACGNEASLMVLKHFRSYIVSSDEPTDWLVDRLGLRAAGVRPGNADEVLMGATP